MVIAIGHHKIITQMMPITLTQMLQLVTLPAEIEEVGKVSGVVVLEAEVKFKIVIFINRDSRPIRFLEHQWLEC